MRTSHRLRATAVLSLLLGSLLLLGGFAKPRASRLAAGQILTIGTDSLTSYLAPSATGVNDVTPLPEQRGVGIDGGLRAGAPHGMAIGGNPFGVAWSGSLSQNGVRLDTGGWSPWEVDIALPAPGFSWTVGRSYSAVQDDGSHHDGNGVQGRNWFQTSQPEILLYDHPSDASKDLVYLAYGADRYVEYQRYDASSDEFRGVNGAAGVFKFTAASGGEPETYMLTDQRGTEYVFFGFDGNATPAEGQIWIIEDEAGNKAYVGDATTGSTAITNGFVSNSGYPDHGAISKAYDTADRRYTYTYTSGRLTEVKAETKTGGTWGGTPTGLSTVAKVDYTYYGDETYGDSGDLKTVAITTPLTDSGVDSVRTKYFRYWEGAFNASTNPGHVHALKYVVDFEGVRSYGSGYDTASNATLEPYASAYFEYDANHRIDEAWYSGACGCAGGATGTHTYEYETNPSYSDGSGYDTAWARRTIVNQPDGSYLTQYFDEAGQGLHRVLTDGDPDNMLPPPSKWVTKVTRDSSGLVTDVHTPANITGYAHAAASFSISTSTSAGLVNVFTYVSSGDMTGFLEYRKHKEGTSGSVYFDQKMAYTSASKTIDVDLAVVRPLVSSQRRYPTEVTTDTSYESDSWTYTMHSSSLVPAKRAGSWNAVSTGKNGSGSSNGADEHFSTAGQKDFEKSESGIITYREYTSGQLTKLIEDADTTKTGSGEDFEGVTIPTGFSSSGTPLHRVTSYTYDAQGRRDEATLPGGRVTKTYYSEIGDGRLATLSYPKYVSGTPTFYGPVGYTVSNFAGKAEVQGQIELSGNTSTAALTAHVDESDSDPVTAIDGLGTLCRLTTSELNETGTVVEESRAYFSIPASGAGTDGANYDGTFYGYDDSGRRWRVKEPSGTIRRTVYDAVGRTASQWIGTNDSSFSGGESSGTDNMVKTVAMEYDGDADDGNGYLTERTLYVEDSDTDKRVTTYSHDVRGRVLLEANPTAPHQFHKYDNMGRRVATGSFSATTNIVVGTDDPTTETSNRLALSETVYDEAGRVYKTIRHKIDPDDGSTDDTLETLHWYNEEGHEIETRGTRYVKMAYDRLGRRTHEYVLANDNDTGYSNVSDPTGDLVLEEHQTVYDASDGNVIMRASIQRSHTDKGASETTGALDTNADSDDLKYTAANITGRIQITAMWYDTLGRLENEVRYGTYGGSDFDRDGLSVPARSDTALRTTYSYADDGTVQDVTDPKGYVHRTEYDDAGRVTKEIRNYEDGTPSGADSDVTVKYEYTDGLRTKIIADLPVGSTDQETEYAYGTTKGASAGDSEIATGHLLQEVTYPDSSGATDTVTYAYNAQGQEIWKEDQATNVLEQDFDDSGRLTHRRVTTLDADFDGAVRRISTAYDSQGRRSTVTQWDNATVGSGNEVDEVMFTYDDWGNVEKFEQDRNGTVGESGSVDDYEVSYTWEKNTDGRYTVRLDEKTLPSGNVFSYEYRTTAGRHDDDASRVTYVQDGTSIRMSYQYLGLGTVVEQDYNEIDVMWQKFSGSPVAYSDMDRFGRITTSKWTKDLATDVNFYDIDISYDRNSNITLIEDNVHDGFDVEYTMDEVDRLTQAEEGTWSGSAITSTTRDQQWTLDQVGNWDRDKLDLNGDGDWSDTDEWDDCRTHNDVNELTNRDTDCDETDDYTLAYDEAGNLTDDASDYEYEWDALGRLRKVNNQSSALVAEYLYNGLGYRIGEHVDTDDDGDVDGSDDWRYFAYDERWRVVASFLNSDTDPSEEFLHHAAGLDGRGSSSYIDLVVMRERDTDANGSLDERLYYCQNWRADVSAIVDDSGELKEWDKYSAYGVPFGMPGGDTDSDGDCDSTDVTQIQTWIDAPTYDTRGDIDLDGDVDSADKTAALALESTTLGREQLSSTDSRRGYAGLSLQFCGFHARTRDLDVTGGHWLSRDKIEYADGMNTYAYVSGRPIILRDHTGRSAEDLPEFKVYDLTVQCNYDCPDCNVTCTNKFQVPLSDSDTEEGGKGCIIQEITFEGMEYDCYNNTPVRTHERVFEVWCLGPGGSPEFRGNDRIRLAGSGGWGQKGHIHSTRFIRHDDAGFGDIEEAAAGGHGYTPDHSTESGEHINTQTSSTDPSLWDASADSNSGETSFGASLAYDCCGYDDYRFWTPPGQGEGHGSGNLGAALPFGCSSGSGCNDREWCWGRCWAAGATPKVPKKCRR